MKALLETYFAPLLPPGEWHYAAMVHFEKMKAKMKAICPECLPYTIHGTGRLDAKLNNILTTVLNGFRPTPTPSQPEYSGLVKNLLFTVLALPLSTSCKVVSEVYAKMVGGPDRGNRPGKAGQGDVMSVVFWSADQVRTLLGWGIIGAN